MKSTLIIIIISMMMCALPLAAGTSGTKPSSGQEGAPVTILRPSTPHNRPKVPSSVRIYIYKVEDILTFDISEDMGVCAVYIGEREDPIEMFSITSQNPSITVSDIENREYQITLVTEGNQIFQESIEL